MVFVGRGFCMSLFSNGTYSWIYIQLPKIANDHYKKITPSVNYYVDCNISVYNRMTNPIPNGRDNCRGGGEETEELKGD